MAKQGILVLDSDIHVMEPHDLWLNYIDPRFRDRAPKRVPREDGPDGVGDVWQCEGKAIPAYSDHPQRSAQNRVRHQRSLEQGERYADARARSYDAVSQLQAMDVEGIDVAVVFRTLASHVIAIDGMDPDLAAANCRAFNRWVADYCGQDRDRLKPSAIIPLHDVDKAVEEAEYAVGHLGHVAVVLPSNPVNNRQLYDPYYDKLWSAVQEMGVPVTFHGIHAAYQEHIANRFLDNLTLAHASSHPIELMLAMGAMICGGVFQRFPELQAAYLEGTCSWLPWWLWRLDDEWEKFGRGERVQLEGQPSDYFHRHCYVSVDPGETLVKQVIDVLGDDRLVISTDWPHDDSAYPHAIENFLAIEGLTVDAKFNVLWHNAARLYGLAG
ncbi:MAG: amidohydrolase family protein [Dehalococcoidia bacterium]